MRRGRGAAGRNVLGIVLILAALVVLGGLASAAFVLRPPPTDLQTLCRTNRPLAAHTIVLVDATDRLEPRHRRKLRAVLAQERARLSEYDRLTVMRLNARHPQEPTVLFSKCLPLPPERTNPLFQNARMTQQQWDDAFQHALDTALRSAQSGGRANTSPIFGGIAGGRGRSRLCPIFRTGGWCWCRTCWNTILTGSRFTFRVRTMQRGARKRAERRPISGVLTCASCRLTGPRTPTISAMPWPTSADLWPAYFDAANVAAVSIDPQP